MGFLHFLFIVGQVAHVLYTLYQNYGLKIRILIALDNLLFGIQTPLQTPREVYVVPRNAKSLFSVRPQ